MDDDFRTRLTRRGFLAGTIAAALAACSDEESASNTSSGAPSTETTTTETTTGETTTTETTTETTTSSLPATTTSAAPVVQSDPFTLGVASGDPLPDSVILWTRLQPAEPLPDADIEVTWEIARDPEFADIVGGGDTVAVAALGHSVHVEAAGLDPDQDYYYRFGLGEYTTPPARTHTFAAPGTMPDRFRFAFSSCQNWEQGRYAAYRDMVEEGDIDAFVFLGDYIYEYASGGYADERGEDDRTGLRM